MVKTWTHGIDNTYGIDLDSWYRIGAPESHKYERAECCSCVGFFLDIFNIIIYYFITAATLPTARLPAGAY